MPTLTECADAMLFLLDYMVGIDKNLDAQETRYFIQVARQLNQNDFSTVQQKIQWVAQLSSDPSYDQKRLLCEACELIRQHDRIEESLQMLRKMAAVDGHIHEREQELFDQICHEFGVPSTPLTLDAAQLP
ncbi:MAG: TerB family tellurite resistance protein [Myxococcales bacterium]|nr:TerB family tellurite resistance protein [Myxococcales bacterium]